MDEDALDHFFDWWNGLVQHLPYWAGMPLWLIGMILMTPVWMVLLFAALIKESRKNWGK